MSMLSVDSSSADARTAPSTRQMSAATMIAVGTTHLVASANEAPIMMTMGPVNDERARR